MTTPTRAALAQLPPYALAEQDLPGIDRVIQLGQNELGAPPSPAAMDAVARAAMLNRYPDADHLGLRRAIAKVHGLDPARIVCGAGSMELLGLIAAVYCEPGVEVVVSQYGYKFFQVQCSLAGAEVRAVPEPAMRTDIDAIAAAVNARTRLIFLVDPNNPTGARLAHGALRDLRARVPEHVMIMLDGAYAEFVGDQDYDDGFALVDAGANVVVMRTFSKAYGLAGLRVGWLYGPGDVVDALGRARAPNSITTPALAAAEAAMLDRRHLAGAVRDVVEERERFRAFATSCGLDPLPSDGNFVLLRCPQGGPITAPDLTEGLKRVGIITRPMQSYGLTDAIRVTIGAPEEMSALRDAMTSLLSIATD